MWYCSCGCENVDEALFCVDCGQPREEMTIRIQPGQSPSPHPPQDAPTYQAPVAPPQAEPVQAPYAPPQGEVFQSSYRAMPEPPAPQPAASRKAGKKAPPAPKPPKPRKKKARKSLWWLWLLLVLALLAVAAAFCYFTVHIWEPATCTEAETCRICGQSKGSPLGHVWGKPGCTEASVCSRCGLELESALGHEPSEADCTKPSVCFRCGETLAPPLGHDWQAADYDRPETCSRCGATQGHPKGWVGNLFGSLGEETLLLYERGESHPYILKEHVENLSRLTLNFRVNSYEGDPFGTWGLYGRDPEGEWRLLGTFEVTESAYQHYLRFPLRLDEPLRVDALSMVAMTDGVYELNYSFYFTEVQERGD